MNDSDAPSDELIALLGALLDGEATADDEERLDALLSSDAGARHHYYRLIEMHGLLEWENISRSKRERAVEAAQAEPGWPVQLRHKFDQLAAQARLPIVVATAATVFLLVTAALINAPHPPNQPPVGRRTAPLHEAFVAEIASLHGARWPADERPPLVGHRFLPGEKLRLLAGLAEIRFADGAQLILEGPTLLEIRTSGETLLHNGSLTATVPPQAVGFSVLAGSLRVVDLGTEFGTRCDTAGNVDVHVFRGSVRADQLDRGGKVAQLFHLRQHDALRMNAATGVASRQDAAPQQFVREMPSPPSERGRLLAAETFDYATGPLIGHSGALGWAETWREECGGESHQVVHGSVGSDNAGGFLAQDGPYSRAMRRFDLSSAAELHSAQFVESRGERPLIGRDGAELYVGFSQRVTVADRTYYGVEFSREVGDANRVLSIGFDGDATGYGVTSNVNGGAADSFRPLGQETARPRRIVVKFVFGAGNADRAEIFLDPLSTAEPRRPDAVLQGDFAFDRIGIANFGGEKQHQVDDLRVADRFGTARGS